MMKRVSVGAAVEENLAEPQMVEVVEASWSDALDSNELLLSWQQRSLVME
jgi:hypothetical protein